MKTIMKRPYAILMAIVCLVSVFSSCKESFTSSYTYVATSQNAFPLDPTSQAIAQAIIDYQTKAGILGTPFNKSVDKEKLTDEELNELDKEATEDVTARLGACNFAQIVKEAGITVPDKQPVIYIHYVVGWPDITGGSVVERGKTTLEIMPETLK
ncbi:hypothetical protein [Phocaeicola sartorii]|uniref:hypothetical protein n=1 Tax=Phocaeicola sartorii TaxID=671267 RepID=UPI001F56B06E|nr:hypothetical protein [Phocaeicola sartorii]